MGDLFAFSINKFLGFKYKVFQVRFNNYGWYLWFFKFIRERKTDHASIGFELELFGFNLEVSLYDTRHYNKVEHRFYYQDEPEYYWYTGKIKYKKDILKFMGTHPEIDLGYLVRSMNNWEEYRMKQFFESHTLPKCHVYKDLERKAKKEIPWESMTTGIDYNGKKVKLTFLKDKDLVKVNGFRKEEILNLDDAIYSFQIYDKDGKLLCKGL